MVFNILSDLSMLYETMLYYDVIIPMQTVLQAVVSILVFSVKIYV